MEKPKQMGFNLLLLLYLNKACQSSHRLFYMTANYYTKKPYFSGHIDSIRNYLKHTVPAMSLPKPILINGENLVLTAETSGLGPAQALINAGPKRLWQS